MNHSKPTVLVIIGIYLPGTQTGGPIRTTSNMVQWLGDDFNFYILTSDHDGGNNQPYPNIHQGTWNVVGKAHVRYLNIYERQLWTLCHIISETPHDIIYLDSVFASLTIRTLLLRRLSQIPNKPVIIPPRGHLHPGALSLKATKKQIFLWLARLIGLYEKVTWHASTEAEKFDVLREFGASKELNIRVISNLPAPSLPVLSNNRPVKTAGSIQLTFLSRISRKKNLLFALSLLRGVTGQIKFDIYGPIEDEQYWEECCKLIRDLPTNTVINYKGIVPFDLVTNVLSNYHLFLLPTLGENFGHVILEALCVGCPVLISDQTPWAELNTRGAGWAFSLAKPEQFQSVIQTVVNMDAPTFDKISYQAVRYAEQYEALPLVDDMRQFFGGIVSYSE